MNYVNTWQSGIFVTQLPLWKIPGKPQIPLVFSKLRPVSSHPAHPFLTISKFLDCGPLAWMMVKLIIVYAAAADDDGDRLFIILLSFIILSLTIDPDFWPCSSSFNHGFLPHLQFKLLLLVCDFYQLWANSSSDPCQPQDILSQCWVSTAVPLLFGSSYHAVFRVKLPRGQRQGVPTKSSIRVHAHENEGQS